MIELVRAYDIQSLIGNAGGYIGIFLGYTICQLPSVIIDTWHWLNEYFLGFFHRNSIKKINTLHQSKNFRKTYITKVEDQRYEDVLKQIETLKDEMIELKRMKCKCLDHAYY